MEPDNANNSATTVGNQTVPVKEMHSLWRNRRKMAYIALGSVILFTIIHGYLIWFGPAIPDNRIKMLGDLLEWFYLTMAAVITSYMGFTTYLATKLGR